MVKWGLLFISIELLDFIGTDGNYLERHLLVLIVSVSLCKDDGIVDLRVKNIEDIDMFEIPDVDFRDVEILFVDHDQIFCYVEEDIGT